MSEEIKAKVVIEADTSGADEAAAALEKLSGIVGDGSIGDALASQFAKSNEEAGKFAEALGGSEEALSANEESVSDLNDALDEHGDALEEAGNAHEDFQGQVEETANQLQAIPASMDEVTKSAQAMSEQVAQSGETFVSTGKSVADVQAAMDEFNQSDPWQGFTESLNNAGETLSQSQIFNPENLKANMAAFSEAVNSSDVTDPIMHIQDYLDRTGQSWENFTDTIGEGRMNALYDMVDQYGGTYQVLGGMNGELEQASKNTGAFTDNIQATQAAMDEFNQSDPWAAFNAGTQDAQKNFTNLGGAVAFAQKNINEFGGVGNVLYGPPEDSTFRLFGQNGFLDSLGNDIFGGGINESPGLLGSIGEIAGGFDAFMRPLMMGQMAIQMVSQVGQAIYNSAAIAEGQGAHGIGTFTGAVDSMGYTMQQVGGSFSESFGKQFTATIDAINQATGDNAQGLSNTGGMLGGALSFASNLLMGGLGVGLMATGIGIPLGFTMTQAGMEGIANNIAEWNGQPPEFTGQQATPGMEVGAQVQQGWSQIPTNVIKGTADSINNTNQILTEASDPSFIEAQNGLSHAQQYLQYQQTQYNAAHPYNQQTEALQSQNDYSTMQEGYAATHPDTYWNDAMKAASQGNWFGGFGPNQSGGGFWANMAQIFAGGPQDAGTSLGMDSGTAFRNWLGGVGSGAANATTGFFSGIGNWFSGLFSGGQQQATPSGPIGCFIAGTPVLMADGSQKAIETLQVGEHVLGYDGKKQVTTPILVRLTPPARVVYELKFSNGNTLTLTDSHPISTPQGWKALSVEHARLENPDLAISTLQIGDFVYTTDGIVRSLISVEQKQKEQIYNISVGEPHTFYVNGILVHNKIETAGVGQQISDQVSGIQLPHIDLSGVASSLSSDFGGIQLPHLDLSGIASGLGGAFSGISLPHLDLSGMASGLAGAFGGIQLPHLDLSGISSALSGAFSGITLPSIPDLGGMISGALGGMFSGISLPSIPDLGGMINGALGGMFSGITLPSIPNLGGMINGALGGMFSGITLPSIPDVGGMISGALGGVFGGIKLPNIPDVGAMINGALGGMFSGIQMPQIPNIAGMINGALSGMLSGISIPAFASGVEGFGGGLAVVGEAGPELVALPGGSSVYPMSTNMSGGLSPMSLGGSGGGIQTANIVVNLDSQTLISLMGVSLMSAVNVGLGKRSY